MLGNSASEIDLPDMMHKLEGLGFYFQADGGIRDVAVTGVQTCALPISLGRGMHGRAAPARFRVSHDPEDGAGDRRDSARPVSNRLFGTDGIRGVANEPPLTPDLAYRVGRELVATLIAQQGGERVRLVIGRDTRLSGALLEAAMVAGLLSSGADCYTVGVLPTPGIALLPRAPDAHGRLLPPP